MFSKLCDKIKKTLAVQHIFFFLFFPPNLNISKITNSVYSIKISVIDFNPERVDRENAGYQHLIYLLLPQCSKKKNLSHTAFKGEL